MNKNPETELKRIEEEIKLHYNKKDLLRLTDVEWEEVSGQMIAWQYKLNEAFMDKYADKIVWEWAASYQDYQSPEFISKHIINNVKKLSFSYIIIDKKDIKTENLLKAMEISGQKGISLFKEHLFDFIRYRGDFLKKIMNNKDFVNLFYSTAYLKQLKAFNGRLVNDVYTYQDLTPKVVDFLEKLGLFSDVLKINERAAYYFFVFNTRIKKLIKKEKGKDEIYGYILKFAETFPYNEPQLWGHMDYIFDSSEKIEPLKPYINPQFIVFNNRLSNAEKLKLLVDTAKDYPGFLDKADKIFLYKRLSVNYVKDFIEELKKIILNYASKDVESILIMAPLFKVLKENNAVFPYNKIENIINRINNWETFFRKKTEEISKLKISPESKRNYFLHEITDKIEIIETYFPEIEKEVVLKIKKAADKVIFNKQNRNKGVEK